VFTKYENLNPRTFKVYNNKYNEHWNEIAQLIGVDEDNLNQDIIPNKLLINYPNPFRTSTTICFSIPRGTKKAKIRIYNIKGQLVKQLSIFNSQLNWEQSSIEWDGKDENGRKLSSGIYFYKLSASGGNADNQTEVVKKMILLK
ncbi:MAG: T9SS type A sorting domain-containing protein, partial [Candidatus Cloacimonetes bacterium]|nr:T9SS type A sorting domain-containing protein [Candidatus Cloacimonadota bacterium]